VEAAVRCLSCHPRFQQSKQETKNGEIEKGREDQSSPGVHRGKSHSITEGDVAGLAATGLKIKPGLANSLKYGKRKPGRRKAPTVASAARRARTSNGTVTVDQLIDVKRLADSLGGIEHVRTALETLEKLQ
jgi:hypothetical protein